MAMPSSNWLERVWGAADALAPDARLALHRRSRIAAAAVILCFLVPMLILGQESIAVVASLLLFGVLPAAVALDTRRPAGLHRALIMGLSASAAVLLAGILRGLEPFLALGALAVLAIEACVAGEARTRRLAVGVLGLTAAATGAVLSVPELVAPHNGSSLSAIALVAVLTMNIAMITHGTLTGLNAHQSATDGQKALLSEAESIVSEVVVASDGSGSVLRISRNSERLLGLSDATLLGRGLAELVLVADRPQLLTALCDCAHGAGPRTVRARLRSSAEREAPRYRWIEARIAASPHADGTAVTALRDISQQVEDEERAVAMAAEAGAANDARAAFLSTVNHELRTPLNAIIGFSELLANPLTTPQNPARLQEYATLINGAGQELLRMITAMIDVTRIDSGIYEFEAEQADLKCVVESAIEAFRQEPEAKGASFVFDAPSETLEANIDQRAFRQVLNQLLSNAAKFGGSAAPISVLLSTNGSRIEIAIVDKGPGIPLEKLEKLGRHFERLDESLARERGGVGLGLSLASGLMALHGGRVAITSKAGMGTTVTLSLLRVGSVAADQPSNVHSLSKPQSLTVETKPAHAAPERLRA
jgi:two-component system, cell cycle sensor histidine kinase DivJ